MPLMRSSSNFYRFCIHVSIWTWVVSVFCDGTLIAQEESFLPAQIEAFEKNIRPLLVKHCYECHSADSDPLKGGLVMDSRESLMEGGDSGAAIVPGKPEESLLISAVKYKSFEMPPNALTNKTPHAAGRYVCSEHSVFLSNDDSRSAQQNNAYQNRRELFPRLVSETASKHQT